MSVAFSSKLMPYRGWPTCDQLWMAKGFSCIDKQIPSGWNKAHKLFSLTLKEWYKQSGRCFRSMLSGMCG